MTSEALYDDYSIVPLTYVLYTAKRVEGARLEPNIKGNRLGLGFE